MYIYNVDVQCCASGHTGTSNTKSALVYVCARRLSVLIKGRLKEVGLYLPLPVVHSITKPRSVDNG